ADGGPVAADGRDSPQVSQRGDGDGEGVGADDVSAHHRGPGGRALGAQPLAEFLRPGGGQVGGGGEAHEQRGGSGAQGGDVGEVLRGGLVSDVARAGPVPAEVPPLHEQVRGGDDAAVGCGDDGRVVAGAEEDVVGGGESGGGPGGQPEFPAGSNGARQRLQGTVALRHALA